MSRMNELLLFYRFGFLVFILTFIVGWAFSNVMICLFALSLGLIWVGGLVYILGKHLMRGDEE